MINKLINAQFQIENSTLCDASCIMCPRDSFNHKKEVMSLDIFNKIVDEAISVGVENILICGFGDTLMDKYLEKRLLYIKDNYPQINISLTNTGHLLHGKYLDLVCEYVNIMKISNYGFSKITYETIHKNLNYEKIFSNINYFLRLKKRPYTIMNFLDLPENHNEIEIWKNYYLELADRIDIWKPHNWGGECCINETNKISYSKCSRALNLRSLYFCANGLVSICCMDFNRQLIIGDIKEQSIIDIINSENVKRIQKIHIDNSFNEHDYICKNCDQIHDRTDALIFSSDKNMRIGESTLKIF